MPPKGKCPHCGLAVGSAPGETTPHHQEDGTRKTCPGVGQPAV